MGVWIEVGCVIHDVISDEGMRYVESRRGSKEGGCED